MSRNSEAEISMRHFPDLSDASISPRNYTADASFQIPAYRDNVSIRKMELDFDAFDDGELGGLDGDAFTTPLPKERTKSHAPLTLSELTPRSERRSAQGSSSHQALDEPKKENRNGNGKQIFEFVRRVLPEKDSVDDMFARRKRDHYQQMGIDLSSKSTARYRYSNDINEHVDVEMETSNISTDNITDRAGSKPSGNPNVAMVESLGRIPPAHPLDPLPKEKPKPREKRPAIEKDTGIARHKPRAGPSKPAPQPKIKSILKPSNSKSSSTLPTSTLTRAVTKESHESQEERPRNNQRRESSGSNIAAIGGGLIDVLVMYGEKLKGSLGFSSSGSRTSFRQALPPMNDAIATRSSPSPRSRRSVMEMFDEPMPHVDIPPCNSKPLTLSDLTPSRSEKRKPSALTLSELSPSKPHHPVNPEDDITSLPSPMRPSKKRVSTESPTRHNKKGKHDENANPPSSQSSNRDLAAIKPKRGGLGLASKVKEGIASKVREGITAKPKKGISTKIISRPRPLAPSHVLNKGSKEGKSQEGSHKVPKTVSQSNPDRAARINTLEQGDSAGEEQPLHSASRNKIVGPMFVEDIYHQIRRKESTVDVEKGKEIRSTSYFTKPAPPARPAARPTVPAIRPASTLPPTRPTSGLSVTRPHGTVPAIRPTVPAAFTFQSDARAAQRNADFEEKRKTWENRATRPALPIPDFAAMHAAQAEAEAARSKRIVPIIPEGPMLTTMVRAREREKFESERRERERLLELARERKERERAELEEREYREARRKAVPKAHEVPDWYRTMPKRMGDAEGR